MINTNVFFDVTDFQATGLVQRFEDSVLSLLPEGLYEGGGASKASNASNATESQRLSQEVSSAHLLGIELDVVKETVRCVFLVAGLFHRVTFGPLNLWIFNFEPLDLFGSLDLYLWTFLDF